MSLRKLFVGLIVFATACFVIGTTIERSSADTHTEAATSEAPPPHSESGGEGGGGETTPEAAGHTETGTTEKHSEGRVLGIDIEAVPFVIFAALASLALAAAIWLRPRLLLLLLAAVVGILVFAALDVREVIHQADDDRTGLAVFAAVIALLHVAAAAVAALMARQAQRPVA